MHHKKALSTNPLIHIFINRINNKLVLKEKDEYKLEFQTPEIMKLFPGTKKQNDIKRNGENAATLEEVELFLVQWNLIDKQYR